jgi:hypothetical protein
VDRELLAELAARLDRRMTFGLSVGDGQIYIDIDGKTLAGAATRFTLN